MKQFLSLQQTWTGTGIWILSLLLNDNAIAWYENNGAADPSWTASDIATSADGAISVFAADMDGDGDMDIVSASFRDDTIAWYENNGAADPTWTASDIATDADGATSVHVADMDGDGDMDIVLASYLDDTISWYENNGAADPTWAAADIVTECRLCKRCPCSRYGRRWGYGYYIGFLFR